jgi:hypothetical protein
MLARNLKEIAFDAFEALEKLKYYHQLIEIAFNYEPVSIPIDEQDIPSTTEVLLDCYLINSEPHWKSLELLLQDLRKKIQLNNHANTKNCWYLPISQKFSQPEYYLGQKVLHKIEKDSKTPYPAQIVGITWNPQKSTWKYEIELSSEHPEYQTGESNVVYCESGNLVVEKI